MNTNPSPSAACRTPPLEGILAATFTPFDSKGELNLGMVPKLVDHLVAHDIMGIYICGSTGEGPSLGLEERKAVTAAYVEAAKGRLRTVVHIGHTSYKDSSELGAHAASVGADAISSIAPYYFKPDNAAVLVAYLKEIASSAPNLPFYYYHIPGLTGISVNPVELLRLGDSEIPNLRGIKYTDADLSLFGQCQELEEGRFDVLFGRDEMFFSGLAAGAKGAVGSTYNWAPALYQRILSCYQKGQWDEARVWQRKAAATIQEILRIGGEAAIKYPMVRLGLDCGPRRIPMRQLHATEMREIDTRLDALGFNEWATYPDKKSTDP